MLTDDPHPPPLPAAPLPTPVPESAIAALDALPYAAALVGAGGRIEAVNEAWNRAAIRGGIEPAIVGPGSSYLAPCDAATGSETAREAGRLVRDVLAARRASGSVEYECTAPGGPRRFFFLLASRLPGDDGERALVSHVDITAVHRGADRTTDREARWSELFGDHPTVVLLIDPDDGRILDATSVAGDFYGLEGEVPRRLRMSELTLIDSDVLRESLRATLWSAQETRHRFPHRLASGETRIVDVYAGPIELDGRQVIRSVVHDVTEQAAAMGERELLATAVRQTAESVVITDLHGDIIYVNPAFERVTGYTRAEVVGQNPRLLQSGVHTRAFYEEMWATLTAHHPWTGELTNRRKDGTLFVEEAVITPVFDENGGLLHYVAVKRDITREREEQAAREILAAIVESAVDGAYALDLEGRFLAWNDAAAAIYGTPAPRVLGLRIFDLAPEWEHERIRGMMGYVLTGATVGPRDVDHRRPDGTEIIISITASPIRSRHGAVTGMAVIARNVTEDRRLAAERATLEAELRQAQKMEAIGRLAGGMAHDFNNLLTAISGYASMVAERLDGTALDDQRQVLHAAERAADLSRRLLAFSRPVPLNPRPIAIDDVLEDAYRMVGRLVPERIDFELQTGSGACVMADPVEVEQLLLNLVVNAADATEGAGRIVVETRLVTDAGGGAGQVLLTVTDAGHGMDAETRSRIFEPFFTTKSPGEGTGLGLATVYGIVQRSGGTIAVDSRVGEGTTFSVRLPVAPRREAAPVATSPAAATGAGHVLVVEDAPVLRELAGRFLRAAGYTVTALGDPSEVLARGIDGIDVLVTDVVMPTMTGPQLLRVLGVDLPTVFMSGYPASLLPDDVGGHPNRAFIEKPFDRATLLDAVSRVLHEGAPAER